MKRFFVILICKILYFIGSKIGKGSSLPGEIALKLCPDILKRLTLPKYIIAVTGSNGKTSTVEMIAHTLTSNGKKVAYNKEGSNQIEGVTTLLLRSSNFKGVVNCDALVIESDERYARHTFKHFTPTHFVVTNLYRDQLTRNVHPEWIYNIIKEAISDNTTLVLNANDPLVSCFGIEKPETVYFSVDQNQYSTPNCQSIYNDGKFCPNCKSKLQYSFYHYSHIGSFECENCGLKTNDSLFNVTSLDLEQKFMIINGQYKIDLAFASAYNVYNILAAFSIASLVGIDGEDIAKSLSNFVIKNGRVVEFKIGNHNGMLITSKHENSVSYNQSINYVKNQPKENILVFIVDAISRKYFTSETSWLWDIDFEFISNANTSKIILSGKYAYDLATRFEYTDIPQDNITVSPSLDEMMNILKSDTSDKDIYVITCFSDKDKLLSRLK